MSLPDKAKIVLKKANAEFVSKKKNSRTLAFEQLGMIIVLKKANAGCVSKKNSPGVCYTYMYEVSRLTPLFRQTEKVFHRGARDIFVGEGPSFRIADPEISKLASLEILFDVLRCGFKTHRRIA